MRQAYHYSLLLIWMFSGIPHHAVFSQNQAQVFINEIRADDEGTDDLEYIELIGAAGSDISGFQIVHYNGSETSDGGIWLHTVGVFTLPDDGIADARGTPLGYYVYGAAGVPNVDESSGWADNHFQQGPDGVVLYDAAGNILDAVAWGGEGDLTIDDPGTVATDVSPAAPHFLHVTVNDDNADNSLQAPDNVIGDDGKGWQVLPPTPGAVNANQTGGDITLPVQLAAFHAIAGNGKVTLRWITESEVENVGFELWRSDRETNEYAQIAFLEGRFNSNQRTKYRFVDEFVHNDLTYWYQIVDVDVYGLRTVHGPVSVTPQSGGSEVVSLNNGIPGDFRLYQNYPNPFNPATTLRFDIPKTGQFLTPVTIEVYNTLGQKIHTLFDGRLEPGSHELLWNGMSDSGLKVSSGVYFAVMKSLHLQQSVKMILLE